MPNTRKCPLCGGDSVEETGEGLFCVSCHKSVGSLKRMVHHELIPKQEQDQDDVEP